MMLYVCLYIYHLTGISLYLYIYLYHYTYISISLNDAFCVRCATRTRAWTA